MPYIKKLDNLIARQFGLLFVGTFFICQFVLMMQFLWRYIDELIGKGLTIDVLAQFFWYLGLMLVPQALPLAILLSSLITYGNLGESSELTAIKSAGVSLLQSMRSLTVISIIIACASFYFQNNIGPESNIKLAQLLISMKQKSPELEIPEGVFYDGIPNTNIYVQKKDIESGKLYGVMIYRITSSFEDAAIILADSGMIQSTAEKRHLLLTLWHGEWFENMQQSLGSSAAVPYRRETFIEKRIVLDFDADFNLTDAGLLSGNAKGKSLGRIFHDLDSIRNENDSIGRVYYRDAQQIYYHTLHPEPNDSLAARRIMTGKTAAIPADSMLEKIRPELRRQVIENAAAEARAITNDLEMKALVTTDGARNVRQHEIEAINKFTLALTCIIFFFIGAPLGAIIRKGGLGIPVIVSVLVFITYFILDNTGYRMAREGFWGVWFGKLLALAVLTPIAVLVTYKANNDSMVFNLEAYRLFIYKLLGLRIKRYIPAKEVIIHDPHYRSSAQRLSALTAALDDYAGRHRLVKPPRPIRVFFTYTPDHAVEALCEELESIIEDLSNTRDRVILTQLNAYPVISPKAHTRPFDRRWLNTLAAIILPLGLILYIRMWQFRLRLYKDIKKVKAVNVRIISRIEEMLDQQA